jgi:N-acetylneuraminic acid mutarotase
MKNYVTIHKLRITGAMMPHRPILTLLLLCSSLGFSQTWVHINNIGANVIGTSSSAPPVTEALCLSVNNKIYVLGSVTYTGNTTSAKIWEYNPALDGWAEKSTYPGTASSLFCGFTLGGMIYAGSGTAGSVHATSDFYKYNPTTNVWTPIANLPVARIWATAFSIGGKGYVTGGEGMTMGSYLGDLWQYDTTANSWSQKASYPGITRALPSSFSSGGSGYVGLGFSNNVWHNDFYKYNPVTDTWTSVSSFPGTGRCGAACVSIGSFAILMCGNRGMTTYNDCYSYDMNSDSWSGFTTFSGSARSVMLCGNAGNKIFAGGGSAAGGTAAYNDWWSLQTSLGLATERLTESKVYVYKSAEGEYVIRSKSNEANGAKYIVIDECGKTVCGGEMIENQSKVTLSTCGMYSIVFDSENIPNIRFFAD